MAEIRLQDHTDTVPEKLRLLQAALDAKRFDLVASLADSIQEASRYEQQSREDQTRPTIGSRRLQSGGQSAGRVGGLGQGVVLLQDAGPA